MNIDATALEEILDSCSDLLTENQEEALKAAIASADNSSRGVVDEAAIERLRYALKMHDEHRTTVQSLASSVGDFLRDCAQAAAPATPSQGVVDERQAAEAWLVGTARKAGPHGVTADQESMMRVGYEAGYRAALPAAQSEFMGWVHEVTWIDGTSRRLHQKEPTPLDDTPGLTSQRIVRVFTLPAVPEVDPMAAFFAKRKEDEAQVFIARAKHALREILVALEDEDYEESRSLILDALGESATPAHDQPEGADND